MSPERLFSALNLTAMAGWLLLAALPRTPWIRRAIVGRLIPTMLAIVYIGLIASQWGSEGSFGSLAGVATLFSNPWVLLAGWVHYLAFDLLIGVAEVEDAQARHVPPLYLIPCLFLTFMLGPAGWLLYQGVRRIVGRDAVAHT